MELQNKRISDEEFAKKLEKMAQLNEFFEKDDYAKYVTENLRRMDKYIRANLYKGGDSVEEERMLLLRQGELFSNQMNYVARVIEKVVAKMLEEEPMEYIEAEIMDALELMQIRLEEAKVK